MTISGIVIVNIICGYICVLSHYVVFIAFSNCFQDAKGGEATLPEASGNPATYRAPAPAGAGSPASADPIMVSRSPPLGRFVFTDRWSIVRAIFLHLGLIKLLELILLLSC